MIGTRPRQPPVTPSGGGRSDEPKPVASSTLREYDVRKANLSTATEQLQKAGRNLEMAKPPHRIPPSVLR